MFHFTKKKVFMKIEYFFFQINVGEINFGFEINGGIFTASQFRSTAMIVLKRKI